MKNILLTILILTFLNCKSDSEKVVSKHSKDTTIHYKNQFKRGGIKDSIASITFDLASEQNSKGNFSKAKKLYKKANDLEPDNKIILNALGGVSADLKNLADCTLYFEKSLKIDSTFTITYMNFGTAYNKLLKFNKSIVVLEKGLELENNQEKKGYFYYNLANSYYKKKDYETSYKLVNKALSIVKEPAVREDIIELEDVLSDLKN